MIHLIAKLLLVPGGLPKISQCLPMAIQQHVEHQAVRLDHVRHIGDDQVAVVDCLSQASDCQVAVVGVASERPQFLRLLDQRIEVANVDEDASVDAGCSSARTAVTFDGQPHDRDRAGLNATVHRIDAATDVGCGLLAIEQARRDSRISSQCLCG